MQSKLISIIQKLKNKHLNTLDEYIKVNLYQKNIVIYGAGGFGKEIAGVLLNHKIKPTSFLDINLKGQLLGIPISHPEKLSDKNVVVVLAIVLNKKTRNEIYEYLNKLGYTNILDAQKIRAMYIELEGNHTFEYLDSIKDEILKPLAFLADEESKETYTKNVISHLSRDYENVAETDEIEQYFLTNIPFKRGFKRFVDCGGYIGDTFLKLLELNNGVEEYIAFEPINENFQKLVQNTSKKNIKSITFPSAVSDKTGIIRFNNMLGSSSINEDGSVSVMGVKLDDVLHNYNTTFIKMDIEGEELKALEGAKEIILGAKPELAICVYHYINHFWEIPNLLYNWNREFNLGYKFYLRTHSSACMETVLYAVMDDKTEGNN